MLPGLPVKRPQTLSTGEGGGGGALRFEWVPTATRSRGVGAVIAKI